MHRPHNIIVHYCEDGGQACVPGQTSALTTDPDGMLRLFQMIKAHQSDQNHFCRNGGIVIECKPMTRAEKPNAEIRHGGSETHD